MTTNPLQQFTSRFGFALLSVALLVAAPAHAQKLYGDFKTPKTAFGQPDLQGFWTNVSLTPIMRARGVESTTYTEEEVAKMENRVEIEVADDLRPVDPDAPAEFEHEPSIEVRPEFASAGGGCRRLQPFLA